MGLEKILSGGDLRSIGKSNSIVLKVKDQNEFDDLFKCLFHKDRVVIMRAADAIEKISSRHPSFLAKHKKSVLELCHIAENKELRWHLALLLPRLNLSGQEIEIVWQMLSRTVLDKKESKIVRVNSIQALYEIAARKKGLTKDFEKLMMIIIAKENVPSINARIRKLKGSTAGNI